MLFRIGTAHGFAQGSMTEYLEIGGQVDVIYTDLEKAFDKVPHQRLLLKLKSYNIHDDIIQWISSFLQSRSQSRP